jgi:hypothetical protein
MCVIFWDGMGNLWIRRDGRLCPRPPWCEEELAADALVHGLFGTRMCGML